MERTTANRRIISIVLFVLAVVFILVGILTELGIAGILLGVAAAIVGVIFYRRGK
jgi:hypothetical protein